MKIRSPLSGLGRPFALGLCVLFALSCATKPTILTEREERARDLEEELLVGRHMAATLIGKIGLLDDKDAQTYVGLVGQTLAKHIGRPELTFHFGVLKSEEINALATPGGYIFVTEGLLRMVRTESELAAILGHEIGHVNERHMYLRIRKKREVSAGEAIARILSRGGPDIAASVTQMVNEGIDILLGKGFSKEQEFEADETGLVYAAALGYNPTSLASFLKRLHQERQRIKLSPAYPPFMDRLKALVATLSKNGLDNRMEGNPEAMKERFHRYLANFHPGETKP